MKRILFSALTCVAALLPTLAPANPVQPVVIAQFGLGNLTNALGAGKDLAVKTALSTFGKSLGDQLPIVVASGDAYPTVPALPGPPFAPGATPDVAAALRSSRDGTIALEPGDYVFGVGVFCMRATAGSPSGHRYVVAPLRGSAADIITALDARVPSYPVDHHVLQVLSWDIQAGMAYAAMQPDQRAAVDRIIPEYRDRLNGDVYERIRDQYTQTTQHVPGMPSFEDALTRVGPVGAQVVALQNLRRQLAQPPPTFEQLAHQLVPMLPAGSAPNAAGDTPWSRYSDRVYVRFTTAGDYSTPGTYQVRVLPPAGPAAANGGDLSARAGNSGTAGTSRLPEAPASVSAASIAAGVPFSNIVNNPGTDAVQPLTQTPLKPGPPPLKHDDPKIIPEAVALTPLKRERTVVGVGEEVLLTFTDGEADWTINTSHDGKVESRGVTVRYTADSIRAVDTITARGVHASATITFTVIPPTGIVDKRASTRPVMHAHGRPNIGMDVETYVKPDNVSFKFIKVRERDNCSLSTGVYAPLNRTSHHPNKDGSSVGDVFEGLGSKLVPTDQVYSGDPGTDPPFAPGSTIFHILWEYQLASGGDFHEFTVVETGAELRADGTLRAFKAGAETTDTVDGPTVNMPTNTVPLDGGPQPPCVKNWAPQ